MPFSEEQKKQVRRKAAYQCCWCQDTGVDIHHILPEAQGGSDDIDNAAPLCRKCHDLLGANPEKRKMIKEKRDWWYEVCRVKYPTDKAPDRDLSEINDTVAQIKSGQEALVPTLMSQLRNLISKNLWTSPGDSTSLASGIISATTTGLPSSTAVNYLPVLGGPMICIKCGKSSTVMTAGYCPDCYGKLGR